MAWKKFLTPTEFNKAVRKSSLIVSHAGMGAIICALSNFKPILVMPREGKLRETRNDHQIDTAKALYKKKYLYVAWNESELIDHLDHRDNLKALVKIGNCASDELMNAIDDFINKF
jgi:UDP-N-acetylglucosamine transferase subunit ALG13